MNNFDPPDPDPSFDPKDHEVPKEEWTAFMCGINFGGMGGFVAGFITAIFITTL